MFNPLHSTYIVGGAMSDEPASTVAARPQEELEAEEEKEPPLLVKRHVQYFKRILAVMPSSAGTLDTSR